MLAVVTLRPGERGGSTDYPQSGTTRLFAGPRSEFQDGRTPWMPNGLSPFPDDAIPRTELRRISLPLYGVEQFRDMFTARRAARFVRVSLGALLVPRLIRLRSIASWLSVWARQQISTTQIHLGSLTPNAPFTPWRDMTSPRHGILPKRLHLAKQAGPSTARTKDYFFDRTIARRGNIRCDGRARRCFDSSAAR